MFIALATGYKAPVIKASMTGNERQEDLTGGKRVGRKKSGLKQTLLLTS